MASVPEVVNRNTQPKSATRFGSGYSQTRNGRGRSGRARRSIVSATICPMNWTSIRVVSSTLMTMSSDSTLQTMAMAPTTRSDTVGNPLVGWRRANAWKKFPSTAAA